MLPKRPYEVVIAETAASKIRPSTFVSKVKRILPTATVLFLGGGRRRRTAVRWPRHRSWACSLPEGALARKMAKRTIAIAGDAIQEIVGASTAART
jgi:hypothetical protein